MTIQRDDISEIKAMDTDDLKSRLARAVGVTARGLYEASLIYEELRLRGEPVEEMRIALAPYLPRIARGEVAAEAVLGLAGFRTALDRVALMPPDKQREVINQTIPVVISVDGDTPTVITRRIDEMTAREVRVLISDYGRVLSVEEQADVLRTSKLRGVKSHSTKPRGRQPRIAIDGHHVVVGKQAVTITHLLDELRKLGVLP